jgi:putative colanic acid biosynthesis UDP-glucose lipid carrier transferase
LSTYPSDFSHSTDVNQQTTLQITEMNKNLDLLVTMLLGFLDLAVLNILFILIEWQILPDSSTIYGPEYHYFGITINLGWLTCAFVYQLYNPASVQKFENFFRQTFKTYILFLLVTLAYLYLSRPLIIPRQFTIFFLSGLPFVLILNRIFFLIGYTHIRSQSNFAKKVMIIGYNDVAKRLAGYFEGNESQMELVGFCEDRHMVKELTNYPILSNRTNAMKASKEFKITEIYSTILPDQDKQIYELMEMADKACIRFKLVPDLNAYVKGLKQIHNIAGMPILAPWPEPLDDIGNRIKKRIFDIAFSSTMIIFVLSWMIPLIAIAIWLDSKGGIFFIQKRSGINNKPFDCIKFRSMQVNKEADILQATRDDNRLTRVGKFLRKTNLDEFPQFFNVLRGEMSIVGPRPHMLKHTEIYSKIINKYMVRQFLKPGITGWAQANGYRGEIEKVEDMEERVNHDLWYMEKWSLVLDFKILILTGYNIIKGDKKAF